ncbi:hypothetical protein K1X76_04045 [bacterium]|nr:hypothetical protein [bacterium]
MANNLSSWSPSLKALAKGLILTLLLGYFVAFLQIFDRTNMNVKETVQYYRGDESGDPNSILMPQSFTSILSVTHVHSFSQPFIFAGLGFIFAFSTLSERKKAFWISLGFAGTVLSNATPWLIRYVAGEAVYLFGVSQAMMSSSLLIMSFVSLKQLCKKE